MPENLKIDDFTSAKDFAVAVARREPQPEFPRHTHEFSELVIITRGKGTHIVDDYKFPVSVGDVFVISGSHEHEFTDMRGLSLVNVMFDPENPALSALDTGDLPGFRSLCFLEPKHRRRHKFESRLRLSGADLEKAERLVAELERELKTVQPGFKVIALALLTELLVHLSRCYGQSENPEARSLLKLAGAINYLEKHYCEPMDFRKLAQTAGMSVRSFQRAFLRAAGVSARQYLIEIRLKRAAELLKYHNCSVAESACRTGFSDSNYFSRMFKKYLGIAPSRLRRSLKSAHYR
ncbi:MAG: helix-turn-helix domain-containing protein [Victivallales bacterium]|nr:helix-turn-helix domain-containing protein [Victivallales bacterium]